MWVEDVVVGCRPSEHAVHAVTAVTAVTLERWRLDARMIRWDWNYARLSAAMLSA